MPAQLSPGALAERGDKIMTIPYRTLAALLWLFSAPAGAEIQPTIADAHAFVAQQLAGAEVSLTAPADNDHSFAYVGYRGQGCRSIIALGAAPVAAEAPPPGLATQLLIIPWQKISAIRPGAEATSGWLELIGDISIGGGPATGLRFYFADDAADLPGRLSAAMSFLRYECHRYENLLQRMKQL